MHNPQISPEHISLRRGTPDTEKALSNELIPPKTKKANAVKILTSVSNCAFISFVISLSGVEL